MRQDYSAVRGASTVSQTYTLLTPVPALTLHVGIKLNERVSLPLRALTLRCENRTLPHVRDHRGEVVGRIFRSAASFDVGNAANVSAEFRNKTSLGDNLASMDRVFSPAIDHGKIGARPGMAPS